MTARTPVTSGQAAGGVVLLVGSGSIGQACVRRIAAGKHVVVADLRAENAQKAADVLADAGFAVSTATVDVSQRDSVEALVAEALTHGPIVNLVHAAGVSPSQASPETILRVDLYGTALVLECVGSVVAEGGSGVVIASQSGYRLHALTARAAGYLAMLEKSPPHRAGTPDEVGTVAELLMSPAGAFITGSDILMDGGVTASWYYGPLKPEA